VNLVSPLAMAGGYSTFANEGVNCEKTGIYRIKDRTGDVIVDHSEPECKRVLDKGDAEKVKSVLKSVMSSGTGRGVQLDNHWSAGKTGTTNDGVAVWFVGFTSDYATAVAVADVEGKLTSLDGRTFNGRHVPVAYGSTLAGPVWQEFMNAMH
jgi:membrane peptidoglycan carboxypeptidase